MGRPTITLEPYREEILRRRHLHDTYDQISAWLRLTHNVALTTRTLKRRINEWGIEPIRQPTEDSEYLRACIKYKFHTVTLDDSEMLRALRLDGHIICLRRLQRIRCEMGLYRQRSPLENKLESDLLVIEAVKKELAKGTIQGYGRTYLYTHMRQSGLIAAR